MDFVLIDTKKITNLDKSAFFIGGVDYDELFRLSLNNT
jgi:hypothetical protein